MKEVRLVALFLKQSVASHNLRVLKDLQFFRRHHSCAVRGGLQRLQSSTNHGRGVRHHDEGRSGKNKQLKIRPTPTTTYFPGEKAISARRRRNPRPDQQPKQTLHLVNPLKQGGSENLGKGKPGSKTFAFPNCPGLPPS